MWSRRLARSWCRLLGFSRRGEPGAATMAPSSRRPVCPCGSTCCAHRGGSRLVVGTGDGRSGSPFHGPSPIVIRDNVLSSPSTIAERSHDAPTFFNSEPRLKGKVLLHFEYVVYRSNSDMTVTRSHVDPNLMQLKAVHVPEGLGKIKFRSRRWSRLRYLSIGQTMQATRSSQRPLSSARSTAQRSTSRSRGPSKSKEL